MIKIKKFIYILIYLSLHSNIYSITKEIELQKYKKSNKDIKLYTHVYDTTKEYNISSIPFNLIQNFIEYPKILSQNEIIKSPRIIDDPNNKKMLSTGDIAYATNIKETGNYLIYRENKPIKSPENKKKIIGTEVEIIGEVATIEPKNNNFQNEKIYTKKAILNVPTIKATPLIILKSRTEIKSNDKLYKLPDNNNYERLNFIPHQPSQEVKAKIFHIYKNTLNLLSSKFSTIIINNGEKNGLDKGTILSIYKTYPTNKFVTRNKLKTKINSNNQIIKYITYPIHEIGKAMVYYAEKDISYAIIIESNEPIKVGDILSTSGKNLEYISNN